VLGGGGKCLLDNRRDFEHTRTRAHLRLASSSPAAACHQSFDVRFRYHRTKSKTNRRGGEEVMVVVGGGVSLLSSMG
jgi:hypothetical protein